MKTPPTDVAAPLAGQANQHQASALFDGARTDQVLKRLELTITRRLDGLLQGDYRGLVPGHGTEPGETRAYQAGDDVRRIDWNVTARMNDPHIRESIADRELEAFVLLDLSPSLMFGTADCQKRDLAVAAFGAVGFLSASGGNRIGAVLASPEGLATIPPKSGRQHLMAMLHRAAELEITDQPTSPEILHDGLKRLNAIARRRGLTVVISDFIGPPTWEQPLRALALRHDVVAVEIIDPRELEIPDVGIIDLIDPESGRTREVQTSDADLRDRYAAAAAAQRATISDTIRKAGSDHLVLRTDRDWLRDLVLFVASRRERVQHLPRRSIR